MQYVITSECTITGKVFARVERKRIDSAEHWMKKLTYEMLAGQGMLDSKHAHGTFKDLDEYFSTKLAKSVSSSDIISRMNHRIVKCSTRRG